MTLNGYRVLRRAIFQTQALAHLFYDESQRLGHWPAGIMRTANGRGWTVYFT